MSEVWHKNMSFHSAMSAACKKNTVSYTHLDVYKRQFYKQHKDIVRLADVLGHSSVDTTRIYTLASGIEQLGQLARMRLLI